MAKELRFGADARRAARSRLGYIDTRRTRSPENSSGKTRDIVRKKTVLACAVQENAKPGESR